MCDGSKYDLGCLAYILHMTVQILARLTASAKPIREKLDTSINHLPFEVIAGALPSDKLRQYIVMCVYMLSSRAYKEASMLIHERLGEFIKVKPHRGVDLFRAMSFQAMLEVKDNRWLQCEACSGLGWVPNRELGIIEPCRASCDDGQVLQRPTSEERYRSIVMMRIPGVPIDGLEQITMMSYMSKWRHVYADIYSYALNQHNIGVSEVKENIQ